MTRIEKALPYFELACAVIAAGLWYTQGGAVWYAGGWPGPWPLALLACVWLLRLAVTGAAFRLTPFDLPLGLFLASAGMGVWAAYDPGPAWAKFWLIVGAMGLYYAVAHQPDLPHLYVTLAFWGLVGVAVSAYFFATNDWEVHPAKVPAFVALGRQVSAWVPALSSHRMHPNVVGGMSAALMPVYVPLFKASSRFKAPLARRGLPVIWAIAAGLAGLGWLTSASRGAWLALASAAGLWMVWRGLGWWSGKRYSKPERAWQVRLWAMGGLGLAALPLVTAATLKVLSSPLPAADVLANRLELLSSSWLLARDYVFTGAGLGMFQMQFSIYTLLIHVGYIVHSHNILLNVLIEQGLAGLAAWAWLVSACLGWGVRRLRQATGDAAWAIEAGLASLVVVLVHGLVDDALYGSRGLLLLFVPLGIVMAAGNIQQLVVSSSGESSSRAATPRSNPPALRLAARPLSFALAALAGLAILGAMGWRPLLGAWYANLGAVEQSRIELGHYDPDHFDNPTMDQVRRQNNLDGALALLERAAQVDPANLTARQRLAAIALSRGQYGEALSQMQAAWDAGYRDAPTRLLLGDAYAANGWPEQAAEVVRGLRWAEGRLAGQAWYRYGLARDYQRAADAWAAVVWLNPGNKQAVAAQAEAAAKAGQK